MAKKTNKKNKKGSAPLDRKEPVRTKLVATKSTRAESKNKTTGKSSSRIHQSRELVFGKENYKWIGIGLALLALGMILMIGGYNENPAVWDESKIYGFQRTLLAPVLILTGLGVQIYAIFR